MFPARHYIFTFFMIIMFYPSIGISQGAASRKPNYEKTAVIPKKQKQYKYIIVSDTKNILYGNKCATRVTHKFGFEYLPIPKSQLITERESSIMFHNLFTNFSITLRRGIFWKIALKQRIRECQRKGRDLNG